MSSIDDLRNGILYQVFSTFDGYDETYEETFFNKEEAKKYMLERIAACPGDDDECTDFFIKERTININLKEIDDLIEENTKLKLLTKGI